MRICREKRHLWYRIWLNHRSSFFIFYDRLTLQYNIYLTVVSLNSLIGVGDIVASRIDVFHLHLSAWLTSLWITALTMSTSCCVTLYMMSCIILMYDEGWSIYHWLFKWINWSISTNTREGIKVGIPKVYGWSLGLWELTFLCWSLWLVYSSDIFTIA